MSAVRTPAIALVVLLALAIPASASASVSITNFKVTPSTTQAGAHPDLTIKEAGDLTSAVVSPRFGPIALAYVRSAHAAPGSAVGVAGADVTGEVVELPFDQANV